MCLDEILNKIKIVTSLKQSTMLHVANAHVTIAHEDVNMNRSKHTRNSLCCSGVGIQALTTLKVFGI